MHILHKNFDLDEINHDSKESVKRESDIPLVHFSSILNK